MSSEDFLPVIFVSADLKSRSFGISKFKYQVRDEHGSGSWEFTVRVHLPTTSFSETQFRRYSDGLSRILADAVFAHDFGGREQRRPPEIEVRRGSLIIIATVFLAMNYRTVRNNAVQMGKDAKGLVKRIGKVLFVYEPVVRKQVLDQKQLKSGDNQQLLQNGASDDDAEG